MKVVLFDMDGVLVEVSGSYRKAIKKTVEKFLKKEITLDCIRKYKNRGGLNNDWDLTEFILKDNGLNIEKQEIIDTFQDFYLGKNFDGLILDEYCLASGEMLSMIKKSFKTGIVTGRPQEEALFTLKRFHMEEFFQVVIAMEDVPPGKGKPDPMGIKLAMDRLGVVDGWYIGDTIDDMIAARAAGLIPLGIAANNDNHDHQVQLLKENGAVKVLKNLNEFPTINNIGKPQESIASRPGRATPWHGEPTRKDEKQQYWETKKRHRKPDQPCKLEVLRGPGAVFSKEPLAAGGIKE